MKLIQRSVLNPEQGFTLVELLVATLIGGIVIAIAGSGMVSIMTLDKNSMSEQQRRSELNRAVDFIADDIRMSRRVNAVNDETTLTAANAITQSATTLGAFNPGLGAIGTPILYLEIPLGFADCPTVPNATGTSFDDRNGDNSLTVADQYTDRVVYDVRVNTSTWLGPRTINRYGRIPTNNPTLPIDPCSTPSVSEVVVDGVAANGANLGTCNGVSSGSGGGFMACVDPQALTYRISRVTLSIAGLVNQALGAPTQIYGFNSGVYNRSKTGLSATDIQNFNTTPTPGATITTCSVPNIIGMRRTAGEAAIVSAQLTLGVKRLESGTGTADTIVTQSPAAGGSTPCGTAINYSYYPQVIPQCTVPRVDGLSAPTAANAAITAAGLSPIDSATLTTGTPRIASNQSPAANAEIDCGTTVTYQYLP